MPEKSLDKEEEYFARIEFERLRKLQEEREKQIAENEKRRLKELHFMRCPKCGMELSEIDYQGVKVDKCFSCEGVWLDSGELEALTALKKPALDGFLRIFK
jgi:hypothetical protein